MIRKFISLLLCLGLVCAGAAAYYPDIQDPALNNTAEVLSVTGIIDGMGDGTFRPNDSLTREQFAKIAVCVLGDKDKAASSLAATAFTDVTPDSWARGYISYVAEKGIISGFPDGSFGGGQILTYGQAVTVLLRCLGYTDQEIGFHWPSDYVNKAEAIGLNKGLSLAANDSINRGQAATLVYNALFTEMNGSADKLISKSGVTVYDDAVLYGSNRSDAGLMETSEGSFRAASGAVGLENSAGKQGELFVNKDKELILFRDNGRSGKEIIVTAILKNEAKSTVDISHKGGTVSIPYSGTVYYDGQKTTALEAAGDMTIGSTVSIYYDDEGRYSSALLNSYVMDGPYTVTQDYDQIYDLFTVSGEPSVIRKGVSAKLEDISRFDVVYYSAATNTVYAYNDKISGIYEKAAPLKNAVTSVTVSGKEYQLATAQAANKLNESPRAFAIGDYITLLLDRDGKVADAVDTSASNINNMGVVLSAFSRVNDSGTQEQAVKLFMADGSTMEYAAADDYGKFKGELVRLKYDNGRMVLSRVAPISRGGRIDKESRTFDGLWLSSDCSILVLADNPENGEAVVRKVRLSDIQGNELLKNQVIHVEIVGEMRDVALMYLKNVNKTDYEYGLITKTETTSLGGGTRVPTGEYTLLMHGKEMTVTTGRRVFTTQVIGVNELDSQDLVDTMVIGTGKKLEAIEPDRIKADGTVYKAAPGFDIYRYYDHEYSLISSEDALNLGSGRVTVYADRSMNEGGLVRLVVVQ